MLVFSSLTCSECGTDRQNVMQSQWKGRTLKHALGLRLGLGYFFSAVASNPIRTIFVSDARNNVKYRITFQVSNIKACKLDCVWDRPCRDRLPTRCSWEWTQRRGGSLWRVSIYRTIGPSVLLRTVDKKFISRWDRRTLPLELGHRCKTFYPWTQFPRNVHLSHRQIATFSAHVTVSIIATIITH